MKKKLCGSSQLDFKKLQVFIFSGTGVTLTSLFSKKGDQTAESDSLDCCQSPPSPGQWTASVLSFLFVRKKVTFKNTTIALQGTDWLRVKKKEEKHISDLFWTVRTIQMIWNRSFYCPRSQNRNIEAAFSFFIHHISGTNSQKTGDLLQLGSCKSLLLFATAFNEVKLGSIYSHLELRAGVYSTVWFPPTLFRLIIFNFILFCSFLNLASVSPYRLVFLLAFPHCPFVMLGALNCLVVERWQTNKPVRSAVYSELFTVLINPCFLKLFAACLIICFAFLPKSSCALITNCT